MPTKRDYYEVLEVGRSASPEELRRAYRRLAKQYHPDVNEDDSSEERFKEINEAYAVLSDEERRASYDRFGHAGVQGLPTDFGFGFADIFEEFFGFSSGGRRSREDQRVLAAGVRFRLPWQRRRARHDSRPLHYLQRRRRSPSGAPDVPGVD